MHADPSLILFLGAGFSSEAGLPTMERFGAESKAELSRLRLHTNREGDFRYAAGLLYEAGLTCENFRAWLSDRSDLCHIDTENVETVFCVAESMRQVDDRTASPRIPLTRTRCSLDYVEEQIRLWLWKVYQQCPLISKPDDFPSEPYDRLIEILKRGGIDRRTVAITTNYDIIFEYVCWKNGLTCDYGLDAEPLPLQDGGDVYVRPDTGGGPSVYKLHGSINSFIGSAHLHQTIGVANDVSKEGDRIGLTPMTKPRPRIFALDAIWELRARYSSRLVPAIIPPTYAKLTEDDWVRQTWRRAHSSLRNAKGLIFIGYSFPPSDGFMESYVQAALVARGGAPLKVAIVNPSEEVHARIKRIFRNVEEWPKLKFSESIEFIETFVQELTK